MAINEKYTKKDFRGQSHRTTDPKEFNNSTIRGAIFSQKTPYTKIFPQGMTGVHFLGCSMINVVIPSGNTTQGCSTQHQAEQNDGEMWHVDEGGNPISPVKAYRFDKEGISKDPKDIPSEMIVDKLPRTAEANRIKRLLLLDLSRDTAKLTQILKDEGKL